MTEGTLSVKQNGEWVDIGLASCISYNCEVTHYPIEPSKIKIACQDRLNMMFVNSYRNIEVEDGQ